MIYSRWRPDRGGYDYFETDERLGIGDDLPIPNLKSRSPIGVASTSIGRVPKVQMVPMGSGDLAHGSIMPLDKSMLSGLSGVDTPTLMKAVVAGVMVGVLLYVPFRIMRRKR